MDGAYRFCARALLWEALAYIAAGFLVGLVYRDWRAIVGAQILLLVAETGGYLVEGVLYRRRNGEAPRW